MSAQAKGLATKSHRAMSASDPLTVYGWRRLGRPDKPLPTCPSWARFAGLTSPEPGWAWFQHLTDQRGEAPADSKGDQK